MTMLADKNAMATIAVKNLAKARKFYGETLGLKPAGPEEMGVAVYASGASSIVVYESEFAGTNRATSATWGVGDELEEIVRTLTKAGVTFEHYDLPGAERKGDVHVFGGFLAAWFKDPEGNILHINNA
jgi:catechol 2,3-dioxygenase-like lactoylglutathione lyase family enzyme